MIDIKPEKDSQLYLSEANCMQEKSWNLIVIIVLVSILVTVLTSISILLVYRKRRESLKEIVEENHYYGKETVPYGDEDENEQTEIVDTNDYYETISNNPTLP